VVVNLHEQRFVMSRDTKWRKRGKWRRRSKLP